MEDKIKYLIQKVDEIIQNTSKPKKVWFRTNEAAEYLSLSTTQLHLLKQNGTIPYSKIGGTLYFKKSDIDSILEENKAQEVL